MRPPDRISRSFALSDFRTQESYHSRCHFRVPRNCQGDAARVARNPYLIMRSKQATHLSSCECSSGSNFSPMLVTTRCIPSPGREKGVPTVS
jgi:hypothetical protein